MLNENILMKEKMRQSELELKREKQNMKSQIQENLRLQEQIAKVVTVKKVEAKSQHIDSKEENPKDKSPQPNMEYTSKDEPLIFDTGMTYHYQAATTTEQMEKLVKENLIL